MVWGRPRTKHNIASFETLNTRLQQKLIVNFPKWDWNLHKNIVSGLNYNYSKSIVKIVLNCWIVGSRSPFLFQTEIFGCRFSLLFKIHQLVVNPTAYTGGRESETGSCVVLSTLYPFPVGKGASTKRRWPTNQLWQLPRSRRQWQLCHDLWLIL